MLQSTIDEIKSNLIFILDSIVHSRQYLNKHFQNSMNNYFLENYATLPCLKKRFDTQSGRQVRKEIFEKYSAIQEQEGKVEGNLKCFLIMNGFVAEHKLNNSLKEYRASLMAISTACMPDNNTIKEGSQEWVSLQWRRLFALMVLHHTYYPEIQGVYELWFHVFDERLIARERQKKKKEEIIYQKGKTPYIIDNNNQKIEDLENQEDEPMSPKSPHIDEILQIIKKDQSSLSNILIDEQNTQCSINSPKTSVSLLNIDNHQNINQNNKNVGTLDRINIVMKNKQRGKRNNTEKNDEPAVSKKICSEETMVIIRDRSNTQIYPSEQCFASHSALQGKNEQVRDINQQTQLGKSNQPNKYQLVKQQEQQLIFDSQQQQITSLHSLQQPQFISSSQQPTQPQHILNNTSNLAHYYEDPSIQPYNHLYNRDSTMQQQQLLQQQNENQNLPYNKQNVQYQYDNACNFYQPGQRYQSQQDLNNITLNKQQYSQQIHLNQSPNINNNQSNLNNIYQSNIVNQQNKQQMNENQISHNNNNQNNLRNDNQQDYFLNCNQVNYPISSSNEQQLQQQQSYNEDLNKTKFESQQHQFPQYNNHHQEIQENQLFYNSNDQQYYYTHQPIQQYRSNSIQQYYPTQQENDKTLLMNNKDQQYHMSEISTAPLYEQYNHSQINNNENLYYQSSSNNTNNNNNQSNTSSSYSSFCSFSSPSAMADTYLHQQQQQQQQQQNVQQQYYYYYNNNNNNTNMNNNNQDEIDEKQQIQQLTKIESDQYDIQTSSHYINQDNQNHLFAPQDAFFSTHQSQYL